MSTIAAIATPPGRGGVGIVRISGAKAPDIARRLCCTSDRFTPRLARLASFFDEKGRIIDSGLLLFFPAPNSYTGEDVIELQAHGSPLLLQALLERVIALGATVAQAGEFTRRAVENGKMHLDQAEAVADCIDAATLRAARQAQRHLLGEFGALVQTIMDALTDILAHLEACLDFPEEDVPPLLFDDLRRQMQEQVVQPLDRALQTADFGERLFRGAQVAIVGPPNVGKSTLLNRLAGRERAIVSDIPGTTRDVLEVDFEVHGIPVRLLDTAGMRDSDDAIEQEGVRRAKDAAAQADVTLAVADATRPETWLKIDADIHVLNKCDALAAGVAMPEGFLPVSAREGRGVAELVQTMADLLGETMAGEEDLLVTCQRHRQNMSRARDHALQGIALLNDVAGMDLTALEWRQAWSQLGEILGLGDVEELLGRIFSRFCIGK